MYKILVVMWLLEHLCPVSSFVTANSDEAHRDPHFIHVTAWYLDLGIWDL